MKNPKSPKDREKLQLGLVELPLDGSPPEPSEIDAAESRWDPWLLALARMELDAETRPN